MPEKSEGVGSRNARRVSTPQGDLWSEYFQFSHPRKIFHVVGKEFRTGRERRDGNNRINRFEVVPPPYVAGEFREFQVEVDYNEILHKFLEQAECSAIQERIRKKLYRNNSRQKEDAILVLLYETHQLPFAREVVNERVGIKREHLPARLAPQFPLPRDGVNEAFMSPGARELLPHSPIFLGNQSQRHFFRNGNSSHDSIIASPTQKSK